MIILPTINSFVRFLHVSPGSPSVNVSLDGKILEENLDNIGQYFPVEQGDRHIQLIDSGDETNPLIDTQVGISSDEKITLALIGTFPDLVLLPIPFDVAPISQSEVLVRFTHLSPNTPNVDVKLVDGENIFKGIEYKQITDFITIAPGVYHIQLKLADKEETLFTSATLELEAGEAYTIYVTGLLGENPPLDLNYYQDQIPLLTGTIDSGVDNLQDTTLGDDDNRDNIEDSGEVSSESNSDIIANGSDSDNLNADITAKNGDVGNEDDTNITVDDNDVSGDETVDSDSVNDSDKTNSEKAWLKEKIVASGSDTAPKIIFTYC